MRAIAIDTPLRSTAAVEAVVQKFGLTGSETKLIFALIDRGNLHAAAAACAITVGTARQYLKKVFRKTGTTNQVSLVVLVMNALHSASE